MFFFSVNETLDDMLEDSGDEEETNGIVNQVLDEIGIEISGKVMFFHYKKIFFKIFGDVQRFCGER